ncbi:MAG: CHAT domain-containing protein [Blastocatellia bacterium]|nr:CHAT domain-containing protein [Blastocatellia bacterium]
MRSHSQLYQLAAGRMIYLSRLCLFCLLWGIGSVVQAQAPSPALTSGEFWTLLMGQTSAPAAAQLFETHPSLVTAQLWQRLLDQAVRDYYAQNPAQAITRYQTALLVAERLRDQRSIAITHYNLGRTYSGLGNLHEAIAAYRASQDAFAGAGCQRDGIHLLSDLGALYLNLEQYAQAQQCAEQALALATAVRHGNFPAALWPDDYGVAGASALLGALERRDGKYEQAITHLKDATVIYQRLASGGLKMDYQIADSLAETGRVYRDTGENATALTFFQQSLQLAQRLPQSDLAAGTLNSIGVLYLEQEDYEQAATYFQRAMQGYQHSGNPTEAVNVVLNLGVTAQRQGQFAMAHDHFQQALQQATRMHKQDVMLAAGEGLGVIQREQGNYAAALQTLEQSLSLAKAVQNKMREAELLWRSAEVHCAQGQFTHCIERALQARQIARQQRLPKLSYLTAVTLGQAYLRLKNIPEASALLDEAARQLEALRTRVAGQEQEQQLFFQNKATAYHLQIELWLQQGKMWEALQASERAKARVLFDAFQRGRAQGDERYLPDCEAPILHPTELRRLVKPNSALLVYAVTPEQTYLFVLRNTSAAPAIHSFTIAISAEDLRQRAHHFQQLIAARRPAFAAEARALYRLLLQPAAAVLQEAEELCIIPDDGLWEVPFQALQTGTGRYALEEHTIRYAPSLSVLTALAQHSALPPTASLLAFGNPAMPTEKDLPFSPLPEAEKEVTALGKLFRPAQIFTNTAATESRFKALAGRSSVLHLATHGVLNNRQPLESYLALANSDNVETEDGKLTAREIMQTKLNAHLVVLSACETARGHIRSGEGVVGLSWAFFLAGSRTLVVSQWQVHSASTADLMVRFFTQRQRQRQNASALRAAALQLLQQPRYQHPYYWASFITLGAP